MKRKKIARMFFSVVLALNFLIPSSLASTGPVSGHPVSPESQPQADKGEPEKPSNDPLPACSYCIKPCLEADRNKIKKNNPTNRFYIIDARVNYEAAQQPCENQRQDIDFKKGERVTVYVINMNPFVYDYTITKNELVLEETAQNIFLRQLGPLFSDFISTSGVVGGTAAQRSENCAADVRDTEDLIKNVKENLERWKRDYNGFNQSYVEVRTLYNKLLDPLADCNKLCDTAEAYKNKFPGLPQRANFAKLAAEVANAKSKLESNQVTVNQLAGSLREKKNLNDRIALFILQEKDLTDKIDRLSKRMDSTRKEITQAESAGQPERSATLKTILSTLQAEIDKAEKEKENVLDLKAELNRALATCDEGKLKNIISEQEDTLIEISSLLDSINTLCNNLFGKANSDKLANMNEAIDVVFAHPDILLTQQFEIGRFSEPTIVTIKVARKEKGAANAITLTADQPPVPKPCEGVGNSAQHSAVQEPVAQPQPAPQQPAGGQQQPARPANPPAGQQQPARPANPPTGAKPGQTEALLLRPQSAFATYQMTASTTQGQVIELASHPFIKMRAYESDKSPTFATSIQPASFAVRPETSVQQTNTTTPATPAPDNQNQDNPPYEKKLRFGIQSFSLSGGIVFSYLERDSFQRVLGIPLDRQGMPTSNDLTNVIGFNDMNRWTIGPVLMLNTLIVEDRHGNFGLHGSVGITGKRTDNTTDIDYFFGPSINFLGRRLFFTAGAYVGKQKRLGGDAYLGAPIGAMDTVPTRTETHVKPGFSLTFRIFPYKRN